MSHIHEKDNDRVAIGILLSGSLVSLILLIWSFLLSWSTELCETVDCLNNYIFGNMKAPFGALTATIGLYSARMLHVRFIQTQEQLRLAREQNVSNSFFTHKKALVELCESLENKHDVIIDTEIVYNLLFPENSPIEMSFSLGIEEDHLVHPFIKSNDDFENGNADMKLIAQLAFESFFFSQATLGIRPKDISKCSHIEVHPDLMNYALSNIRNAESEGELTVGKPTKIPLLSKKWGDSESKVALIARSLAKFANTDLRERRLSDKLSGFAFLDASLPNMQGIKLIPPREH